MLEYKSGNRTAIILLHEIYGVNLFVKQKALEYYSEGYDVFCPNLLKREEPFTYDQQEQAYRYFKENIGFDCYREVEAFLQQLKQNYEKVFIIGFSIGATIAWRCSESAFCDGAVCVYGSRIRDYLDVTPNCPVLALFAERDSFNVTETAGLLRQKEHTTVTIFEAEHGFLDYHTKHYNKQCANDAEQLRRNFLLSIR